MFTTVVELPGKLVDTRSLASVNLVQRPDFIFNVTPLFSGTIIESVAVRENYQEHVIPLTVPVYLLQHVL